MAITNDFFNVTHYEVTTKIEHFDVEPGVEFTLLLDIMDVVRWKSPADVTGTLYVTSGRNETALSTDITWTAPTDDNKAQWTAVATIDAGDWDGKAPLRLDMLFDSASTGSYQLVGGN